jgi:hypothetical protein
MRDSFYPLPVEAGFCECGCGQRTKLAPQSHTAFGWVKGQPIRFIQGHQACRTGPDFIEDPDTHCWIWQRAINAQGYAYPMVDGKRRLMHRTYYEDFIGLIPDGLVLDHLCRNRACVNPGHLEPVTNRENILRGEGACAQHARKTHCKHGHPFDAENTRVRKDGGRECLACERERSRTRVR